MAQFWDSTVPDLNTNILTDNQNSKKNEESLRSTFSGESPPANPVIGQKYYNITNGITYVCRGNNVWEEDDSKTTIGKDISLSKGTKPSLNERLSVSLNDDGTLKIPTELNISEWVSPEFTYTYISANQFSVEGNQTDIYTENRAIKATLDLGVVFSYVQNSTYDGNKTIITLVDSLLTNTLQKVEHGIIKQSLPNNLATVNQIEEILKCFYFIWQPNTTYQVGQVVYPTSGLGNIRLECVTAGISGTTEPTWPSVGQMIIDGTAKWIIDDVRDNTPVGRSVLEHRATPRAGYIKKNGALINRADFPRLWSFAQNSGLLVTEAEWTNKQGCFSTGDGTITFRIPEGRAEFERGADDGRGIDTGRIIGSNQVDDFKSHTHITGGANPGSILGLNVSTISNRDGLGVSSATGGTETRPRNIALLSCIKY